MSRVEVLPSDSESDHDETTATVRTAPSRVAGNPATAEAHQDTSSSSRGIEESTLVSDPSTVDIVKCECLKLEGNKLFARGDFDSALNTYLDALKYARLRPLPPPPSAAPDVGSAAPATASTTADAAASSSPKKETAKTDDEEPLHPDYLLTSQVFCNAAACLQKQNNHADAIERLTEALRHQPKYEKALLRRADSYYTLGKWSSAYADWDTLTTQLHTVLDSATAAKRDEAKRKTDEEMQKMLGQLKDLGNMFLGKFGLSTDNFKFDKDPNSGSYSMRFEK